MKYLNVAEKNNAAKNIANLLSGGTSRWREGLSLYNKIYEFEAEVGGNRCQMVMTSVSGHLFNYEFGAAYKNWDAHNPRVLFTAPVTKNHLETFNEIKKTIQREVRNCQGLIIWTDCDREGENIGFEIINVCREVNTNLRIHRARFSDISRVSVTHALEHLEQPNRSISDAVDVRQELDLRIGAVFTRFQTKRIRTRFPNRIATMSNSLISYGSCQTPTLGFVVDRYKAVNSFVPEIFWKITVTHTIANLCVEFIWERIKLSDELACQSIYRVCLSTPQATVSQVQKTSTTKLRPLPLNTVELQKLASTQLRYSLKQIMEAIQNLYLNGLTSYPRTETNAFPQHMNLSRLVWQQIEDPDWGLFAQDILDDGGPDPRNGDCSDNAHLPIYPVKYIDRTNSNLSDIEISLYELIARSFLACCSKDAEGIETTVSIDVANEKFTATGLRVTARNYLEVYPYEGWSSKEIHAYENGQTFDPKIEMTQESTLPPKLLTEADLIGLMDKHGIGTDATNVQHIETIKSRSYVQMLENTYFKPEPLGIALVDGYESMGLDICKPGLRADLEAELKEISKGEKTPRQVLERQIDIYQRKYEIAQREAHLLDAALTSIRFGNAPSDQPASGSGVNNTQNHNVKCYCYRPAILLTCRKDNSNRGRQFYKCTLGQENGGCKFFEWKY